MMYAGFPEPIDYSPFIRYILDCDMCRNGKERLICLESNSGLGVRDWRQLNPRELPGISPLIPGDLAGDIAGDSDATQ